MKTLQESIINERINSREYKDGKPLEETKEFESDIYDIILDLRKVATNNGKRK